MDRDGRDEGNDLGRGDGLEFVIVRGPRTVTERQVG